MRKHNNLTTTLFAGLFLTVVRFNLLKSQHINKETIKIKNKENKETFYPFFFFKRPFFIFVTMMILYKFGNLNFIVHPM